MISRIRGRYKLQCPNTKYEKRYWWRFCILDLLALLFRVEFEVNDVKFGTPKNNPLYRKLKTTR